MSLAKQAQQFWSFLDDLSSSDPRGYSEFICSVKQQAKAFSGSSEHARPHAILTASFDAKPVAVGEGVVAVIVSVFGACEVPQAAARGAPVSTNLATQDLPYVALPCQLRKPAACIQTQAGKRLLAEVAVHPAFLLPACQDQPEGCRQYLVEHCTRFVEAQLVCRISRTQRSLQVAWDALSESESQKIEHERLLDSAEGMAVQAASPTLLQTLHVDPSGGRAQQQGRGSTLQATGDPTVISHVNQSGGGSNRPLIEELN